MKNLLSCRNKSTFHPWIYDKQCLSYFIVVVRGSDQHVPFMTFISVMATAHLEGSSTSSLHWSEQYSPTLPHLHYWLEMDISTAQIPSCTNNTKVTYLPAGLSPWNIICFLSFMDAGWPIQKYHNSFAYSDISHCIYKTVCLVICISTLRGNWNCHQCQNVYNIFRNMISYCQIPCTCKGQLGIIKVNFKILITSICLFNSKIWQQYG